MGYFQVRYDSRVVNYNRIGFIRLATGDHCRETDLAKFCHFAHNFKSLGQILLWQKMFFH